MSEGLTLTLAFATGLFGALHCLGMCSGIAGGLFVRYRFGSRVLPVLQFHAARILVYSLLGVAGAAIGRVLVQTGIVGKTQGVLMMAAGVVIVAIGLDLLGLFGRRRQGPSPTHTDGTGVVLSDGAPPARPWLPALAGAFNGFVPCSLVFSVAVKAAATADPLRAAGLMTAFGLGTLPTMGLVSLTGMMIGAKARGLFARLAAAAVVVLGLWTLYEGAVFFDIMRGLGNW